MFQQIQFKNVRYISSTEYVYKLPTNLKEFKYFSISKKQKRHFSIIIPWFYFFISTSNFWFLYIDYYVNMSSICWGILHFTNCDGGNLQSIDVLTHIKVDWTYCAQLWTFSTHQMVYSNRQVTVGDLWPLFH